MLYYHSISSSIFFTSYFVTFKSRTYWFYRRFAIIPSHPDTLITSDNDRIISSSQWSRRRQPVWIASPSFMSILCKPAKALLVALSRPLSRQRSGRQYEQQTGIFPEFLFSFIFFPLPDDECHGVNHRRSLPTGNRDGTGMRNKGVRSIWLK